MSYILKALRKSEAERKASLNDSSLLPSDSTVMPEATAFPKRKLGRLVLLLILLAGIYGASQIMLKVAKLPKSIASPLLTQSPAELYEHEADSTRVTNLPQVESLEHSPAISDLWQQAQQEVMLPEGRPVPQKPKVQVKTLAPAHDAAQPKAIVSSKVVSSPIKNSIKTQKKLPAPELEADEAILNVRPDLAEKQMEFEEERLEQPIKPRRSGTPFLSELSADFQAKIPPLTINVLAYDEQAHDRFVMIDMVKYKIGQRIKGKFYIVDILPDGLLLNFDKQDFRLLR